MLRLFLVVPVALFLAATPTFAQRKPRISWETAVQSIESRIEPAEAKPGQTVTFKLIVKLHPEHWTYPTRQPDQRGKDTQNKFVLPAPGDLVFVGPFDDPPNAHTKPNPAPEGGELSYYPDGTTWEFKAVVSPKATAGEKSIALDLTQFLVCNEDSCLAPGRIPLKKVVASVKILDGPMPVDSRYATQVTQSLASPSPVLLPQPDRGTPQVPGAETNPPSAQSAKAVTRRLGADRDHGADMKAVLDQLPPPPGSNNTGFWKFLATAAAFGFLTLLTPCVFPMVPITVSIFLKQSEKQGTNVLALALVYAFTIVVLLSVAALTLLTTFSRLAVDPITNVLLGALFVALALSLFGLFELTLPSSLATALDNRAAKGGYIGTVFMAASFTVVSFTCVAPFLGGFSGMASSGNFSSLELAAGALTFASAFASPFFLLAFFPKLIKKLPKSGDWMNMVKVTMGFLELAAALKFFRTAELRWLTPPEYFTYDFVLSMWVAILLALALYLFGMFRTKHDHEEHDHVGPWRIVFALISLGLALYLVPALFAKGPHDKNRPAGTVYAWVDAFLLPEPSAGDSLESDLPWSGDLELSLDDARSRNGRIFVDFTGKTCSNCKLNENNVFTKPEVKELFKRFTLVQLYTDEVPTIYYEGDPGLERRKRDARVNLDFEDSAFGQQQLPLYVILKPEPGGKTSVLGIYDEGKINNEDAFLEFLRNGLK
jgi:thiol:disulfide interchange protein